MKGGQESARFDNASSNVNMHYTLILYNNEKEHVSLVRCLIKSLEERTQLSGHQEEDGVVDWDDSVLVRCCPVNENFEVVDSGIEKEWTTLNSLETENLSLSLDTGSPENESDSSENASVLSKQDAVLLPDFLHDMADSLPFTGFTLDVYVISLDMKIESCMLTVGALLRLRDWHKAEVRLVVGGEASEGGADKGEADEGGADLMRMMQTLCEVLQASFLCCSANDHQLACLAWSAWRGDLLWPGEKGFLHKGISLECTDRERLRDKLLELDYRAGRSSRKNLGDRHRDVVLGRHLEVLTHVSLNSVPLYLLDDFTLQLHMATASPFGELVETLNHKGALLLRIPLYERGAIPVASDHGLTTAAWKKDIAASAQAAPDPGKGPLPCRQHLFLMVSGGQDLSGPLTVTVLRSPTEVDTEMFDDVHEAAYFGPDPLAQSQTLIDSKICDLVENLPLLTAADFHSTDDACTKSFVQCIKEKKSNTPGKSPVSVKEGEVVECVREGQKVFLQQGQRQSPSLSAERQPLTDLEFVPLQDLENLCSEWPERRALLENESIAKVLRRYQSNESCSLMLSSPLGPEDSSMDAKDMVKWFRPDGNAIHEDLSPVKLAVRPHQLSHHDEISLEWPACKDLQYHDVYYEHSKKSERQERFFQKFRDNILLEESLHVCSDKPGVPALRYRNHSRRHHRHSQQQMDITCGGSKLTPITRPTLSPTSMLQATPSAKRCLSRESDAPAKKHSSKSKAPSKRERQFSAPTAVTEKGRSQSLGGHKSRRGEGSEKPSSLGDNSSEENGSKRSSSVFYPQKSDPTLPPFRRLSKPDVSIFTPVTSQKLSAYACSGGDSSSSRKAGSSAKRQHSSASSEAVELRSSESTDSMTPHKSDKKSRSQRHKKQLEKVVRKVLGEAGVDTKDSLYIACFSKLYQVTYFYAKQLPDSHNLKEELKSIAGKQVEQVVDLERRRKDLAAMKRLGKSGSVGEKSSQ